MARKEKAATGVGSRCGHKPESSFARDSSTADRIHAHLTLLARLQAALGLGRTPTNSTFDFDASLEIDRLTVALEDAHGEIARLRQALAACRGGET